MWHPGATGASVHLRLTTTDRALTDEERRIVARALVRCGVASAELAQRAVDCTVLLARAPSLSEVRGPRSLIAHVALARAADGIALGRRVFLRMPREGDWPIDLIAHEVAHVAQYLRDGTLPFLWRYLRAYAAGRARGLDDHRAYLAIPYEVEARAVAATADPSVADVRVLR